MVKHIVLDLEAPLMAFGGEIIDQLGVIRPFPAASMLTGLLANALGWRRIERARHQRLQDRLVFAVRIDREPHGPVQDFQTAQLGANDRGWTTRGESEGRAGGAGTYNAPHLRYRDYHADMRAIVALRLQPADDAPTLDALEAALQEPARPLFIGRKPCLPTRQVFGGFVEADTALAAVLSAPLTEYSYDERISVRLLWPVGEDAEGMTEAEPSRTFMLTDQRNWISGLHGGGRPVRQGEVERSKLLPAQRGQDA